MQKQTLYEITPDKFLDEDERRKLLKVCKERSELDLMKGRKTWPVRYMLIDLALFSGLRVMEMAALKIGDINLKAKDPYLIVRHGKRNKVRTVYIDKELQKHLKNFISYKQKTLGQSIESDTPLFTGRNGKQSPTITLMKSWDKAIETALLPAKYTIHSSRHTFATFLFRDTRNLKYVQKQLGHANIAMTANYADIIPEDNGKLANMIKR